MMMEPNGEAYMTLVSRKEAAYQATMEKQSQPGDFKSSLFSQGDLSFYQSPSGSEVLRARVEEVITSFNTAMEQSQLRTQRLRQVVMKEAEVLVAKYEKAEARRQEALSEGMNELLGSLGTDLEELGQQEEELNKFSSGIALFVKDLPMK